MCDIKGQKPWTSSCQQKYSHLLKGSLQWRCREFRINIHYSSSDTHLFSVFDPGSLWIDWFNKITSVFSSWKPSFNCYFNWTFNHTLTTGRHRKQSQEPLIQIFFHFISGHQTVFDIKNYPWSIFDFWLWKNGCKRSQQGHTINFTIRNKIFSLL